MPGEHTTEPTFGLPAIWIDDGLREEASFRGYTVVDPATVLTTHLTEIIKDNMAELLSYAETQKLLDELPKEHQKLVDDLIPGQITVGGMQRVLQAPARRARLDPRPAAHPRGIAEAGGIQPATSCMITEHVRARLARQICDASPTEAGVCRSSPCRRNGSRPSPRRWSAQGEETPAGDGALQAAGIHPPACARPSSATRSRARRRCC